MRATSIGHAGILIETRQGSILCDPWFVPAFFGSWFVFPRNDQLDPALQAQDRATRLPLHLPPPRRPPRSGLPQRPRLALARRCCCPASRPVNWSGSCAPSASTVRPHSRTARSSSSVDGLRIAIHVETSISDGPGGDSALVVSDGDTAPRRPERLPHPRSRRARRARPGRPALAAVLRGDLVPDGLRRATRACCATQVAAKVDSQLARALRYVEGGRRRGRSCPPPGRRASSTPSCSAFNVITGDELSIFPDQRVFLDLLAERWKDNGILAIPGTTIDIATGRHPHHPSNGRRRGRARSSPTKRATCAATRPTGPPWLAAHKAEWLAPRDDLLDRLQSWWEPLLAMAPTLRQAVGGNVAARVPASSPC